LTLIVNVVNGHEEFQIIALLRKYKLIPHLQLFGNFANDTTAASQTRYVTPCTMKYINSRRRSQSILFHVELKTELVAPQEK